MYFDQHIPAIEQFYLRLRSQDQNCLIQQHLIEILEHIYNNSTSFHIPSSMQTQFYQEFSTIIQGQSISYDTCFALIECLIIFCREKQLRTNSLDSLPLPEQKLLKFYEKSDLWSLDDGTLLHMWYWHTLPDDCS